MKLLIAIVNSEDSQAVISELTRTGFPVTKLTTSGGFLRTKNTTLFMGIEEEKVSQAIDVISHFSKKRSQPVSSSQGFLGEGIMGSFTPNRVTVGGATVFVLDVEQFYKL